MFAGGTFFPPAVTRMSFLRSMICRKPSSVKRPTSPVLSQPSSGKASAVAAVWLQEPAVKAHLEQAKVASGAMVEARKALVQTRIDQVNSQLASYESIKKFVIIDEPLTVESGLLTSTLKVRRKEVYKSFGTRVEALYE